MRMKAGRAIREASLPQRIIDCGRTLAVLSATAAGALVVPLSSAADARPYDTTWGVTGAGVHRSSPTLGDLSVGKVVLSGDIGGWLSAIRSDGSVAWRSPVDPQPGFRTGVESTPAVGDLFGDSANEVVVGAGWINDAARQQGGVVAFRGDGSTAWRWRSPDRFGASGPPDGVGEGIYSSPSIGDVDGDGRNDVVFGGWDHNIWALRGHDGSVIPGFPFENTDTVFSSPALYDVDGDGRMEIFIGGDQNYNPADAGSYRGGVLRALRVLDGRVAQMWRKNVPDIVASSPAIGDIDGDGRLEAVFGSGGYWNPPDNRRMWAVHIDDGSDVPGWPRTTDGMVFGSPVLGDVVPGDGGRLEVVVGDLKGVVYAWRGNGTLAWKSTPGPYGDMPFHGGPSLGDLDGDGDQDIALGYGYGGALLLRGTDGLLIKQVVGGPYASDTTPLVADFGGTVGRRLVVSGYDPKYGDLSVGQVAAFELAPTSAAPAWPMFRRDPRHLAAPPSGTALPSQIPERYQALGGAAGFLGQALTTEQPTPLRFGRYQIFQNGTIHWSPASGAWETHGNIRDKWGSMGWENGFLGFPVTNQAPLARGGAFNRFQGGQIYWSPGTGAREVRGSIFTTWGRHGWENGRLGYPTSDGLPTPRRAGAYNTFEGGSIYWSPTTGAREVRGAILGTWSRSGWENGYLGFPVTDEQATPVRQGAYNHFEAGSIYWSPGTGAQEVRGAIRDAWARSGWENGCLGFPVTGEQDENLGGVWYRVSRFERGLVTWSPSTGARVSCG